ncbi:MAG: hypothetical protein Alpg2KO_08050 [Alphaproteobacteria bacterium]
MYDQWRGKLAAKRLPADEVIRLCGVINADPYTQDVHGYAGQACIHRIIKDNHRTQ